MLSMYKLTCLQELRQAISIEASSFTILTIAKAMAMGVDEVSLHLTQVVPLDNTDNLRLS